MHTDLFSRFCAISRALACGNCPSLTPLRKPEGTRVRATDFFPSFTELLLDLLETPSDFDLFDLLRIGRAGNMATPATEGAGDRLDPQG